MSEINIEKVLNKEPSKLEEKILKAIFKRNNSILDTIDIINETNFTVNDYACIYKAMVELYKKDDVINYESVLFWLEENNYNVDSSIIKKLYNEGYTAIKIKKSAEILKELYQRRTMLERIRTVIDNEEQCPSSSNDILGKINDIAMKSNDLVSTTTKDTKCCSDMSKIINEIEDKLNSKNEISGLKTGINVFDKDLNGLQRGRLYTIVADSQVGKSALAVQLAVQALLLNKDINATYFSLEMDKDEVTQRALACITDIEPRMIDDPIKFFTRFDEETSTYINYYEQDKNSEIVQEYKQRIKEGVETLNSLDFHIDDSSDLDILSLEAKIKKNSLKWGHVDLIFVDHLGVLCQGNTGDVVGLMDQAYNKLKQLAKKLNCVVIALHQFSNELKNDPTRFPNIFSLRGSSAPRHYSDVICGIYRPAVYPELIKNNPELKDVCQLVWQKVRYTKKPETTDMEYNGYMFTEKYSSDFGDSVQYSDITLEDDI